jgi:hypothetical protein
MLNRFTVSRFHRRIQSSRTEPSIVFCETGAGEEAEFFIKLRASGERGEVGLVAEIMAAQLASDLDLPVPQSSLLEVTAEFAATIPKPEIAAAFQKSLGWNFGSRHIGPGFATWPQGRLPSAELRTLAAEIFAFDALIQNPDRRAGNPNCLTKGSALVIIDHELAFDFIGGGILFWKPIWEGGDLGFLRKHVFYETLRKTPVDFNRLGGAIEALTADHLKSYAESVPAEWPKGADAAGKILDYLLPMKTNITKALDAIAAFLR